MRFPTTTYKTITSELLKEIYQEWQSTSSSVLRLAKNHGVNPNLLSSSLKGYVAAIENMTDISAVPFPTKFESGAINKPFLIPCPVCNDEYLHHQEINVYERDEDELNGLHTKINNKVVTTDNNMSGNPSLRRDGLSISFLCEGCQKISILDISQHKGNTFAGFRTVGNIEVTTK